MPTRPQVEALRRATGQISGAARGDLQRFAAVLDPSRPDVARDALLEYVPALSDTYGALAADVAAEWWDDVYRAEVGGRRRALPAPTVPHEALERTIRWAVGGLYGENLATLALLLQALDKWVKQPARDTVATSTARSGGWWARVPTGAETCAFCLMLASRGFDYSSEAAAGGGGDEHKFHADCDCQVVPTWDKGARLDGYDPDALYEKYARAAAHADSQSTSDILAALREQEGVR